jgi:hypothetical protein
MMTTSVRKVTITYTTVNNFKYARTAETVQLLATWWMTMVQFPTEAQTFLSAAKSRLNLGPTQTPIKWILTAPSP